MSSWRDVKTTRQSYDGRRIKIGDLVEAPRCSADFGIVTSISLKGRDAWLFFVGSWNASRNYRVLRHD